MNKEDLYELIDIQSSEEHTYSSANIPTSNKSVIENSMGSAVRGLESVLTEFPYFQTARLLYTLELQNDDKNLLIEELSKTALLCADRKKLFYSIQPENYREFIDINTSISNDEDRTEELLNSYFKAFGEKTTELNFAPTDYFTYLESLGDESSATNLSESQLQHQDIIDAFIEKNETDSLNKISFSKKSNNTSSELSTEADNKDDDSEFLTETLAKIYIKQKKYDKALTIIKRLSLNFPKKSAYFADQIRFLEYLIINDKKNS